ncbi:hypothetical protein NDU88_003462 [Pleurodeles waltl]|uniref:Uncharacterized protein n=1 Tax=Pleurodeles waltl TaxID=8319 RepID=A0AAV7SER0_PLEWA|nr:hypothetical protein NDU88_003462 [Pleurodeles waltl]
MDGTEGGRPRRRRSRRHPESLGGEPTGADTFTVPTLGRRLMAPGSTRVDPPHFRRSVASPGTGLKTGKGRGEEEGIHEHLKHQEHEREGKRGRKEGGGRGRRMD